MTGRAKRHADNIINLPSEEKITSNLVTTERLKEYGFLSEAVGSICSFQDFYAGRPIKRKTRKAEDVTPQSGETETEDFEDRSRLIMVLRIIFMRFYCLRRLLMFRLCFVVMIL